MASISTKLETARARMRQLEMISEPTATHTYEYELLEENIRELEEAIMMDRAETREWNQSNMYYPHDAA